MQKAPQLVEGPSLNWLPRSNGNRTLKERLNALLGSNPYPFAYFHIPIITPFDYVNRKKGINLTNLAPEIQKLPFWSHRLKDPKPRDQS